MEKFPTSRPFVFFVDNYLTPLRWGTEVMLRMGHNRTKWNNKPVNALTESGVANWDVIHYI